MSHFCLLVVSDTPLNEETLKPILQPWHEYESTGTVDQYVIDVDITDKVLEEFNKEQKVIVLYNDKVFDRYDERFWRYPETGANAEPEWSRRKELFLPEGAVEKTISATEARGYGIGYKTMEECAEEYYGGFERDGKFYNRTNPNKQWDWWVVGGRYAGRLIPGYDPNKDPANSEVCWLCQGTGTRKDMVCENGCNGCSGTGTAIKWPSKWRKVGDIAQMKDVPLAALRYNAEVEQLKWWDECQALLNGRSLPLTWNEVREANSDLAVARKVYHDDPIKKELEVAGLIDMWDCDWQIEKLHLTREGAALRARNTALSSFAIVKDGKWYEKGSMGWWGVVVDEKDTEVWSREQAALLDSLSPEAWIAIVDCHI